MNTYYGCGILKDIPYIIDNPGDFQIQDLGQNNPDRYIYPGDSIKYELDSELVVLYDTLQNLFFKSSDFYYADMDMLPMWTQYAGQNSDFNISAETFQKLITDDNSTKIPNLYKHLYLVDCQFLVGTIQNLLCSMEDAFIRYYIMLTNLEAAEKIYQKAETEIDTNTNTICIMSEISRSTSSLLETYFTKAYSILDIICKICYEFQNKNEDFKSYKKIKSTKILWGDRKNLLINGARGTLFEPCDLIRTIESLRNESVHNGTWELNPKIFVHFKNNIVVERFMLFPDMFQGRLITVKGRKHFFNMGIKVNDVLPHFHIEFKNRLLNTIYLLNGKKF